MKRCAGVCFVLLSLFVASCQKDTESLPLLTDSVSVPFQEVVGESVIHCYDSAQLLWKLKTDYSRRLLDDTSPTLVVPVNLVIYDNPSNGSRETHVVSDSGRTGKKLEKFYVWGNVFVSNWDGMKIKARSLVWNKVSHKVTSDDFVELRTPGGDVLRGKGLDATETFSTWSLRSGVSGEFPNFKSRMDKGESF